MVQFGGSETDTNFDLIRRLINETIISEVIVDEAGGIGEGKCCFLTGNTGNVPTIALASVSDPDHVPLFGVSLESGNNGDTIKVIRSGYIAGVNINVLTGPAASISTVLYLGENGDLVTEPSSGLNGNYQIARVVKVGTNGIIGVDLISFILSAEFDGVIRSIITNTSDGTSAGTSVTTKNDAGNIFSIGITGSNNSLFGSNQAVLFNTGVGTMRFVNGGNIGYVFRTNTGAGTSTKMELSASGLLELQGTMKALGVVTEDGGIWTDTSGEEAQIQFDSTAFTIPNSSYGKVLIKKSSDQTLSNGVWTDITFDSEDYDNRDMHDNVTDNQKIVIARSGLYLIIGTLKYEAGGAGIRCNRLTLNGTPVGTEFCTNALIGMQETVSTGTQVLELSTSDELVLQGFHNGPATLDVLASDSFFNIVRLY